MAYLNLQNSLRYDMSGRKRRKKKSQAVSTPRRKKSEFKEYVPTNKYVRDEDHREKYPSLMEKQVADGTFNKNGGVGSKKEPMRYTGTLIKGIATMHKSNAVPIIDDQHAKDIARMRR